MNAKEIVTKTFEKAKLGGYKIEEVDEYLRDVSVEFKKLQNENEELEKKLEVLAAKIREYRNDEDALRDALLIAKKQGIAVVNEAKEQAEKITKEAKEKADKTIKDADALAAKKGELAEKTLADANEKAKQIVGDATAKSEEIHTVMMQRTEREQIVLQRTRKEVEEYTSKLLTAYNAHIEYIKGIPAQCENEFVISTAKEVEGRKPEDSAFAKKAAPEKENVKPDEKKAEEKPESKPEEKPEEKSEEKPEPKKGAKAEDKTEEEPFKPLKQGQKPAEKKADAHNGHKGDSILFNLNNEKGSKGKHESLEFGNNK